MTTMPIIEDRMVEEFRRTGKRRTSYSNNRGGRVVRQSARVVQQAVHCAPCGPTDYTTDCYDDVANTHWTARCR